MRKDRLKARLPLSPSHPRSLLSPLEALPLCLGRTFSTVIAVDEHADPSLVADLFGGDIWPVESALVRFDFL